MPQGSRIVWSFFTIFEIAKGQRPWLFVAESSFLSALMHQISRLATAHPHERRIPRGAERRT